MAETLLLTKDSNSAGSRDDGKDGARIVLLAAARDTTRPGNSSSGAPTELERKYRRSRQADRVGKR